MSVKERLRRQLVTARKASEGMLAAFTEPEQWLFQVHPTANHALWFAGHMGVADNFFLSIVAPQHVRADETLAKAYGKGSRPSADPADNPPVRRVLDYMRDRRQALLASLEEMSEADLAKDSPVGRPDFFTDLASVFELAVWHEGLHSGQLSIARRALGNAPLMGS